MRGPRLRKITYFPDRPNVMATYSVRIEGEHPVLLSNGNLTASGEGWAEWHDPHPKPSYLFALVAGDSSQGGPLHHRLGPRGAPAALGPPRRRGPTA